MTKRAREDKFAGAYVQDPIQGRHEWVYDLDITSMYPSVIRSLNISPETKIGKVVGWDSKEFIKKDNKKTYSIEVDGKNKGKLTEAELKEYFGEKVYDTYIKRNVRLGEAPSHGKPILLYDATSTGAQNYMHLVSEFLNRNG